jgi:glutaminyl-peptide cyclotransferase
VVFDEKRAFELLLRQVDLGHRYPGSAGHGELIEFIKHELDAFATDCRAQLFEVPLQAKMVQCQNVLGLVNGAAADRKILVGTHFDTRLIADRDPDREQRKKPILGANDGASGTAVMLEMARLFSLKPPPCNVIFAFFDAEDVGNIDGNEFYRGSSFFSQHMGDLIPDEVIILDMVGSRNFCMDIDLNLLYYRSFYGLKSLDMILSLIHIARRFSYTQFYGHKKNKFKYIGCDHIPFLQMLIPACIVIDIDYPQWHTQKDLPEFCSPVSLKAVGDVVMEYIYGNGVKAGVGERKI